MKDYLGQTSNPIGTTTHSKDAKPFVPGTPYTYTWYDEGNTYMPGRLDYMLLYGKCNAVGKYFVFETANLDLEILQDQNLLTTDSRAASDHLPVIADFTLYPDEVSPLSFAYSVDSAFCANDSVVIRLEPAGGYPPICFRLMAVLRLKQIALFL